MSGKVDEPLLRAVLAAPEDDSLRLVYADALLERGDPRGELIIVQCRLAAAGSVPDPGDVARADALLAQHKRTWTRALGRNVLSATFERGFASAIKLRCDRPMGEAMAPLDSAPIRQVTVVVSDDDADDDDEAEEYDDDPDLVGVARWLAADGRTARLEVLDLSKVCWEAEALSTLLTADLRLLEDLWLGDDAGTYAAQAIRDAKRLDSLRRLGFFGDPVDADFNEGMAVLAGASAIADLRALYVPNTGLRENGARALAASPFVGRLKELDFSGGSYSANSIGDAGLTAIACSATLGALEDLSLGGNDVSDEGLIELAASTHVPALRSLALNSCAITAKGITALAASARFGRMESLALGGCKIGVEGALAIARSPHAGSLRWMNLHGCGIGADGARALAESPHMKDLKTVLVSKDDEGYAIMKERFGARES